MEIGRAFAIAFGLAFLILGGLYLTFRSGLVAQQQRENPALPQSKIWLRVHDGFTALTVAICLYAGTVFLISGFPNYFVRAGFATCLYAQALRIGLRFKLVAFRIYCLGNVLGGSLCAVGSVLHGGPIGVLGAIGSNSNPQSRVKQQILAEGYQKADTGGSAVHAASQPSRAFHSPSVPVGDATLSCKLAYAGTVSERRSGHLAFVFRTT